MKRYVKKKLAAHELMARLLLLKLSSEITKNSSKNYEFCFIFLNAVSIYLLGKYWSVLTT